MIYFGSSGDILVGGGQGVSYIQVGLGAGALKGSGGGGGRGGGTGGGNCPLLICCTSLGGGGAGEYCTRLQSSQLSHHNYLYGVGLPAVVVSVTDVCALRLDSVNCWACHCALLGYTTHTLSLCSCCIWFVSCLCLSSCHCRLSCHLPQLLPTAKLSQFQA